MTIQEVERMRPEIRRSWGRRYRLTAKRMKNKWRAGYVWNNEAIYHAEGETILEAFANLDKLLQ